MSTLILSQKAIRQTMALADYITAVEGAFRRLADGRMSVPAVVHMAAPGGAVHVKSAAYVGEPGYVAVKVNSNFPDNPRCNGLPTIQGAIVLCDGKNGALLAIMDSAEVTAMRTGAASAVAAKFLANPDARIATVIGCGIQGRVQLLALLEVLPLEKIFVYDLDRQRSETFADRLAGETGLPVIPVSTIDEATRVSQAIVTCTSSRAAFLGMQHVSPGTFIAAVGADNHDKQELEPALMRQSKVVVDLLDQCAEIGDLHHALVAGSMKRSDVCAELSAVVAGACTVRESSSDIVVFDSTGSAIQDVAAAGIIYERAIAAELGQSVDLS